MDGFDLCNIVMLIKMKMMPTSVIDHEQIIMQVMFSKDNVSADTLQTDKDYKTIMFLIFSCFCFALICIWVRLN